MKKFIAFILVGIIFFSFSSVSGSIHKDSKEHRKSIKNSLDKRKQENREKYSKKELEKQNLITTIIFSRLAHKHSIYKKDSEKKQLINKMRNELNQKSFSEIFNIAKKELKKTREFTNKYKVHTRSHHVADKKYHQHKNETLAEAMLVNEIMKTKHFITKE